MLTDTEKNIHMTFSGPNGKGGSSLIQSFRKKNFLYYTYDAKYVGQYTFYLNNFHNPDETEVIFAVADDSKKTEEKLESTEETIIEKDTADKTELASGVAVAGAAVAGAAARAKQATTYESEKTVDDTIIKSIDETTLDKENLKTVDDDRDLAIKSKFNTSFDDYEEGAVDENINSLTSKITTVLIILLVLIIAIVVATFLLQQIGL